MTGTQLIAIAIVAVIALNGAAIGWMMLRAKRLRSAESPKDASATHVAPVAIAPEAPTADQRSLIVRLDELTDRVNQLRAAFEQEQSDVNARFLKQARRISRSAGEAGPADAEQGDDDAPPIDHRQMDFLAGQVAPPTAPNGAPIGARRLRPLPRRA